MVAETNAKRRSKNSTEPDDCHPRCSKKRPCNGAVCPNKRQVDKSQNSQNSKKKNNKPTSCRRSCSKDKPCLGEVCQYKTQQPDVGTFGQGLFLGFLLGLIFAKLIATI